MSESPESIAALKPVASSSIGWRKALVLIVVAAGCFHAAYTPAQSGPLALLMIGYVMCLVQLVRLPTLRQSFCAGLLTGLLCFGPQLECFWRIFGPAAIPLWLVLAFWIALFAALAQAAIARFGIRRGAWLIPFLWTGLEYFRSELYYLKFSWLNVGYAFSGIPGAPFGSLGVYGIGFCAAAFSAFLLAGRNRLWSGLLVAAVFMYFVFFMPMPGGDGRTGRLHIAGVQLEFPNASQIQTALDQVITGHTNVDLIVMSEYALDDPPSDKLRRWCREHGKFLVIGGKDPAPNNDFYDTAFVVDTNGEVVFKQVKSVPIQFFKDGLPATVQKLWDSPWGKIGICICYDLSYARVTDELARQGAQLLIVPTMDVQDWGGHQHELHARIAPVRAAELGVPIFRLASSGISQAVNRYGIVCATASFPGEGESLYFEATLAGHRAALPLDRYLAPVCVVVTAGFTFLQGAAFVRRRLARRHGSEPL